MIVLGIEVPEIEHTNTLSENVLDIRETDRFDVILANPVSGFTSGTDKLDFATVSGSFTAETVTHAANLAAFISAADTKLNGSVDFYFDSFGGNGYLAYDNNGTGITALIQLIGVTNMVAADLI